MPTPQVSMTILPGTRVSTAEGRPPKRQRSTTAWTKADPARPGSPRSVLLRRYFPAVAPGDLGAAADAELAEDLAQVVLHGAGADEQPGGDLPVSQVLGDQAGDLLLLRGELRRGLRAALAGLFAGGAQLGPGPGGEGRHAHRVEHRKRGAQLVAGVTAAALAAQPLPVQQVCAGEFCVDASAAKAVD